MYLPKLYSHFLYNNYEKEISSDSEIFSDHDIKNTNSENSDYMEINNKSASLDLSLLKNKVEVSKLKESVQEKIFKVHQLFNWESLDLDSATLSRLKIMAKSQSWSQYLQYHDEHLPSYKTVTNYNSSTRQHVEEKIKQDPVLCASFAVAVAEWIAEGSNTTIPTRGGATRDLPKVLPESHYTPEDVKAFDKQYLRSLPNGTVLTAQYNGSSYKDYGPTHSMTLVDMKNGEKWLLHLFHTSMALTPLEEVKTTGNKFSMNIAGKNTGFTLVDGSKLIVPNYNSAESQEKRKNNPRKRYTIESTQAMTAYQFADSVSKTLRIPLGAANMIMMDQNNISSLDQNYTHLKVRTLWRKQPLTPEQENSLNFSEPQIPAKDKTDIILENEMIVKKPENNSDEDNKKPEKKSEIIQVDPSKPSVIPPKTTPEQNSNNTYQASEKVQKMYGSGKRRRG